MTLVEKKLIDWFKKQLPIIGVVVFSILRFYSAWTALPFFSGDMSLFLIPWYEQIQDAGGLAALSQQVGNYGILYQFFIAIMTYIPVYCVTGYKLFSLAFDFLLAFACGLIVWKIESPRENSKLTAAIVYIAVLLSPIVQMNSTLWGQCDSIYVSFVILAIYFLASDKFKTSFILLGVAFAFKLQAIFILPLFIIWYIKTKKFSILHFLLIPATMIVTNLPGLIMGRPFIDIFSVFFSQVSNDNRISINAANLGAILAEDSSLYQWGAPILLTFFLFLLFILLVKGISPVWDLSLQSAVEIGFFSAYICFLTLPNMHERYSYMYEILGIILGITKPKTLPFLIPLLCLSLLTYRYFLFKEAIPSMILLGFINILIFMGYTSLFYWEHRKKDCLA